MTNHLNLSEIAFLRKLCQPVPFTPTPEETAILSSFLKRGYVKGHDDGSLEVTVRGSNRYCASL